MMRYVLAILVTTTGASSPPIVEKAAYARWLVSSLDWGTFSTISTMDGFVGAPFGNPVSFADSNGVPYTCVSPLDQSIQDLEGDSRVALSMSEAQFGNVSACLIPSGDPENPPCARLVVSGTFANVTDLDEWQVAKSALYAKHPAFDSYGCFDSSVDNGHDFFLAKIDIKQLWLINIYGGATIITPADYYNVSSSSLYLPASSQQE